MNADAVIATRTRESFFLDGFTAKREARIVGEQAGEQRFVIIVERGRRAGRRSVNGLDRRRRVPAAAHQRSEQRERESLRTNRHGGRLYHGS